MKNLLHVGDIQLDLIQRTARRGEYLCILEPRQFQLLAYLMQHADRTMSFGQIAQAVWPRSVPVGTVRAYVRKVRQRLWLDDQTGKERIQNVLREGYRFNSVLPW